MKLFPKLLKLTQFQVSEPSAAFSQLQTLQQELQISQSCSQKVLSPHVAQCANGYNSMASGLKTRLAIGLAVCQLLENGVPIPKDCETLDHQDSSQNHDVHQQQCMAQIFAVTQFWTTFDACYKLVNLGCLKESFHSEASKILKIHVAVSEHLQEMDKLISENSAHASDFFAIFVQRFETFQVEIFKDMTDRYNNQWSQMMAEIVPLHVSDVADILYREETTLRSYVAQNEELLKNSTKTTSRISERIGNVSRKIERSVDDIEQKLDRFESKLSSFSDRISRLARLVSIVLQISKGPLFVILLAVKVTSTSSTILKWTLVNALAFYYGSIVSKFLLK